MLSQSHIFTMLPKNLILNMNQSGDTPDCPLTLSANPTSNGVPQGLIAMGGVVYNALPDKLPALFVYNNGLAEIRQYFGVNHITEAKFAISGSALLIQNGELVPVESPLPIRAREELRRIGVGILPDGQMLVLSNMCTVEELQLGLHKLGAYEALMLDYDDVYIKCEREGIRMGEKVPVTVLEAKAYRNLPRPIIVLDAGHDDATVGAARFGLRETDVVLTGTRIVQRYLESNYEGTFLLTRNSGASLSLKARCDLSNAIGADYFFAFHLNSWATPAPEGTSLHIMTGARDTTKKIANTIHSTTMAYLAPYGCKNRGIIENNFHVLRETKCPAFLYESLFISNPKDNELIKNGDFLKGLYVSHAEGIAKALGLKKKVSVVIPETTDVRYKVQVGCFAFRKGAEQLVDELKGKGYSPFIVEDKIKKQG